MNFLECCKAAIANPSKLYQRDNYKGTCRFNSKHGVFEEENGCEFVLTRVDVESEWEEIIDAI